MSPTGCSTCNRVTSDREEEEAVRSLCLYTSMLPSGLHRRTQHVRPSAERAGARPQKALFHYSTIQSASRSVSHTDRADGSFSL
jgi:hypothetical protein